MAVGLRAGLPVRIHALKSRPELNGECAMIDSFIEPKGRFAVKVADGSVLLLRADNLLPITDEEEEEDLQLEVNDDDDDDGPTIEGNQDDNDDDGVQLEGNDDSDDDDGLQLEDNEDEDEDEDGLLLEDNDDDGDLQLELNDDDGVDDEDGLVLEGNDDDDEEEELELENNDDEEEDDGLVLEGEDGLLLHELGGDAKRATAVEDLPTGVEDISTDDFSGTGSATGSLSGMSMGMGMGSGMGMGFSPEQHATDFGGSVGSGGLAEALSALGSTSLGSLESEGGMGIGKDGKPVMPDRFLIPEAKSKLEEALSLASARPGETERDRTCRVLQEMTADKPYEVFSDAARQIVEAYGDEMIAERMRHIGDDHFKAGCYAPAMYAYTAGIERHVEAGDEAHLMHAFVNRSAAFLKLGETELAKQDADAALQLSEKVYAPKQQRNALLRRAQALFELGRHDAAKKDLEELGDDPAASKMLEKLNAVGECV